jgi:hypothetical protein
MFDDLISVYLEKILHLIQLNDSDSFGAAVRMLWYVIN